MPPKLIIEDVVLNSTSCKVAPEFNSAFASARAPSLTLLASVLLMEPDSSKTNTTLKLLQSRVCGISGLTSLAGAVLAVMELGIDLPAWIKAGLCTSGLSHSGERGASDCANKFVEKNKAKKERRITLVNTFC